MQKLLLAFVSVVTLMGLVAPSSALTVQERSDARDVNPLDLPIRRGDGDNDPQPSYKFNLKYHGEQRDIFERPTRRADNNPQPSHKSNNNNRRERRDLFERPTRRADNNPQPSHKSNNNNRREQRGLSEPPTRRADNNPQPSHKSNNNNRGEPMDLSERQERNSDRLARGLPPLPPARRGSASTPKPPNHFEVPEYVGVSCGNHVEIRDTNGQSLGFLTDFTGSGQDLLVKYHPNAHALSYDGDDVGDVHFLGAYISQTDLGSNSPAFVYLTNVRAHDPSANAYIWSLDGDKFIATWKNSDGSTAPVHFCLDSGGNIVLAGDPSMLPSGYSEVYLYRDN